MIYYIGGASASGKSIIADTLGSEFGLPVICLDKFHNAIIETKNDESSKVITRKISTLIVDELLKLNARCIVEGGWIGTSEACRLKEQYGAVFHPAYCGYPSASEDERLDIIMEWQSHWLHKKDTQEAINFIKKQIIDSGDYRDSCRELGLLFFDFSDISTGANNLRQDFITWLDRV